MLVRFFRGTGFGPIVILVLAAVGLWVEYLIEPPAFWHHGTTEMMPLWDLVVNALTPYPSLSVILSFILMFVLIIIMARFNTAIFFISRRTYFPALFYILLFSIFPGQMVLNPAMPAAILIMLALWRMMVSYRRNGVVYNFFDAAMIISFAGLIYAGAIWFLALVLIGTILLRTPDIREISAAFFGALLPWALFYAIWYLAGKNLHELSDIIQGNLFSEAPSVYWSRTLVILVAVTGIIFLPALYKMAAEIQTQKIKSRKSFSMFTWMLVISLAIFLFVPSITTELNAIAAIPASYILANYFTFTRRVTLAEIFLQGLVIALIVSRIWPY